MVHRVLDLQMRELAQPSETLLERYRIEEQKSPGYHIKLHRARVIQPSKTLANKLALGTSSVFFECISRGRACVIVSALDILYGALFFFYRPVRTYLPL